jgi:hypothetical protein
MRGAACVVKSHEVPRRLPAPRCPRAVISTSAFVGRPAIHVSLQALHPRSPAVPTP